VIRFTIFDLHFDDGACTVSCYIDLIYSLKIISHKQFAGGRQDTDLSTLVYCVDEKFKMAALQHID